MSNIGTLRAATCGRGALAGEATAHADTGVVTTSVLRTLPEIETIRDAWLRMQQHPNAELGFFVHVVESMPEIQRPHVIVLSNGAGPVAILAGRIENSRVDFKLGYAGFLRPRSKVMTFVHRGLLGNPSRSECETLVSEVLKSLRAGEADVAFFNHLRSDSPLYRAVLQSPGAFSRDYFPVLQPHRSMKLPASVQELHRSLPRKIRKNQRWNKLLHEYAPGIAVKCFREPAHLQEMVEAVEGIAQKTYHRGLGVGFVDNAAMRKRLSLEAQKGQLRTFVLYAGGAPLAFWMGQVYQGVFHSEFMGFDPNFGRYSPGTFLVMQVIEGFCGATSEDTVTEIDFGLGDGEWKTHLANCEWSDGPVYIFAPTLRGLRLNAIRTPIVLGDRLARGVLERIGLLARIKKLWREWATGRSRQKDVLGAKPAAQKACDDEDREAVSAE